MAVHFPGPRTISFGFSRSSGWFGFSGSMGLLGFSGLLALMPVHFKGRSTMQGGPTREHGRLGFSLLIQLTQHCRLRVGLFLLQAGPPHFLQPAGQHVSPAQRPVSHFLSGTGSRLSIIWAADGLIEVSSKTHRKMKERDVHLIISRFPSVRWGLSWGRKSERDWEMTMEVDKRTAGYNIKLLSVNKIRTMIGEQVNRGSSKCFLGRCCGKHST